MNDERDELLKEIGAALSIEPTPEFAAKVRTEIQTVRAASQMPYVLAATAALAVLVAVGAVVIRQEAPAPTGVSTVSTSPPPARDMAATVPDSVRPASEALPRRSALRHPLDVRSRPRVIVATDEVEAFWRLLAAVQTNDLTIPPAGWRVSETTGEIEPLPEIAAIELPAVTIEPLPMAEEDKVGGTDE
jgi:hypothetical protein